MKRDSDPGRTRGSGGVGRTRRGRPEVSGTRQSQSSSPSLPTEVRRHMTHLLPGVSGSRSCGGGPGDVVTRVLNPWFSSPTLPDVSVPTWVLLGASASASPPGVAPGVPDRPRPSLSRSPSVRDVGDPPSAVGESSGPSAVPVHAEPSRLRFWGPSFRRGSRRSGDGRTGQGRLPGVHSRRTGRRVRDQGPRSRDATVEGARSRFFYPHVHPTNPRVSASAAPR